MKLVIGIGNPGREYAQTRHNLGFRVVDAFGSRCGAMGARNRFHAEVSEARVGAESVLLLKPQTFVNNSGIAVREALDWYRCPLEDMLVVCDDFALPLGQLRVRRRGSSGGHKGLQSIADALGTTEYPRLRLGIGHPPPPARCDRDYVLSPFCPDELPVVEKMIATAVEAVLIWVEKGLPACMEAVNRRKATPAAADREEPN